ncbi:MAG: ABC transporter permease [Candidatus Hodarchaeota archaeon]
MGSLRSFVMIRIALLIPMMWLLITMVFFLLRVLPGANPVRVMNPQLPESEVQRISNEMGLNRPLWEQYTDFIEDAITFDFGNSYRSDDSINEELQLVYGPTVMLAVGATLIGVPLGVYLGAYAGAHREKIPDHLIRLFTLGVFAIPIFLVGIMMQLTFGEGYGIEIPTPLGDIKFNGFLPPLGIMYPGTTGDFEHYTEIWFIDTILSGRPDLAMDIIMHLIMSCTALGMLIASSIARQVRINMIAELEQDYVHFARSRGISERAVKYRYALKNSVTPVIGLIGLQFALLLAGAILTETTFNIPGLGRYLFLAIQNKDFPAVQGAMVVFIVVVSLVSLLSDVLYALVDPRIKY